MAKQNCVAMILAGGQGNRLGVLTKNITKSALHFGGKYRIIDFTLSNCRNSGIDTVGIITQSESLEIKAHVGNGEPWGFNKFDNPIYNLSPRFNTYKGTANAIYQNIDFIDKYDPQYVLVLSGDHIYTMNYGLMLKQHIKNKASVTIGSVNVPWKDTYKFGVMCCDENDRLIDFEEKPVCAGSNLASMGIYIFNWKILKEYLIIDENDRFSSNDFGKDVVPLMLRNNEQIYAYRYKGYWKDVGTLDSLLEAHMDLLPENSKLQLDDENQKIYSRNYGDTKLYISKQATVSNSIVEGCEIYGTVENSVIFPGVRIYNNSIVKNSVIMPNTEIRSNVRIENTIIGTNTIIGDFTQVGCSYSKINISNPNESLNDISVIGHNLYIDRCSIIPNDCMIESNIMYKNCDFDQTLKLYQ